MKNVGKKIGHVSLSGWHVSFVGFIESIHWKPLNSMWNRRRTSNVLCIGHKETCTRLFASHEQCQKSWWSYWSVGGVRGEWIYCESTHGVHGMYCAGNTRRMYDVIACYRGTFANKALHKTFNPLRQFWQTCPLITFCGCFCFLLPVIGGLSACECRR